MSDLSPSLLRNLAFLRWFAMIGQSITVPLAIYLLALPINVDMRWPAIGL